MTAALRLVRASDPVRDAELDLGLVERYFDKAAAMGPRTLTPEQMRNFAVVIRRGREMLAKGRKA